MTTVETVTGPVEVERLAPMLYHEHITLDNRDKPGLAAYWLPKGSIMAKELTAFAAAGGRSMVSLTNQCMGRDIIEMRRLSLLSGVKIVLATGYYTRPASPPIRSVKALAADFVRELTFGIGDTDIRAQVIGEVGTGAWPIGQFERDLFDAAAMAHRETGAPIATHTHGGKYAAWQLDRLMSRGVPAEKIALGHLDEGLISGPNYLGRLAMLARHGCFLGFDTVGITYYSEFMKRQQPSDEMRAKAVRDLVDLGLSGQILLSHDICRPDHLVQNGGWGYGHLFMRFLPLLHRTGIDPPTALTFVGANPVRWLAGGR
jgi:phosphotriesterase-related protein